MKKRLLYILVGVGLVGVSVFSWLTYEIERGGKALADGSNDYVIILGAKVNAGGVPSLSLKSRLDIATGYLQANPHVIAIVSGGQGADEEQTEASFMAAYLINKGIVPERILLEEQSTSTFENLKFSKLLLPAEVDEITIISNDFHLRRATYLANSLGLKADVLAAATPKSVEFNMRFRERLALLKTYIVGQ